MTRFDRRALFATGAAAALLAATGVSASPQRGGRLRAALSPDLFERAVAATVYDNLTEIAADGTLRGELATDWHANADATRWTFALREGVQFHDGTAFTAASLRDLPVNLRIVGDHRVEVILDTPDANLPFRLAQPGYEVRGVTGTGLYRVRKLDAGRHFVGVRVAGHWKTGAGWFDSVDFVQFGADAVRGQALTERLVDVVDVIALDDMADPQEFQLLPTSGAPTHIANRAVTVPLTVGKAWPLDNFRMAERWWMG
ncbi:ABC transporter substrate-binding protein [uncultured Tateyamaria sp.]|uniref:ABC transporter substrate-binding protein n=1 Tax=Tateyamaria sp. 1078 TaxID=3417464 RepID=UPI002604AD8B|nr:ABC transporter substrate-binding protein [uncultured Tateyamaria sp.]